ncbi:hypothetical protein [Streptomyces sp. RKAG337]|uniref:hypothetical protein n=1 Tax=Streptomyces sp. RKAG337 TaxID=2893404 RepID=UPI0020334C78|nr:hypothetical protein [Streptomyces sp. RKAG337]MCM2427424.1 hypothetical protein [Streptomyces sp. RKAG337]
MTSTTGMDAHPEVSEISDLAEGILPPGRSADVRGHLDGCALCSDVRTSLDEIRNLLGTLPGPPRMPADIAGRIDAALAAEALLDATAPPAVPRGTADASVPRGTAAAADRPTGHAPASTGPGRGHARPRRRWARTLLVTASTVAVLGFGGVLLHSIDVGTTSSDTAKKDSSAQGAARTPAETPTEAMAASALQARVHELLGTYSTAKAGGDPQSPALGSDTPANTPLRTHSVPLPPCVQDGVHRSEQPLASAHEPFEGTDAYLVVLPHPGDPAHVDLYVVDAGCSTKPGRVLRQDTYAR